MEVIGEEGEGVLFRNPAQKGRACIMPECESVTNEGFYLLLQNDCLEEGSDDGSNFNVRGARYARK